MTDAIQAWVEKVAMIPVDESDQQKPEVCIIELGGTIGDIEGMPFVEAFRQFQERNIIEANKSSWFTNSLVEFNQGTL